MEVLYSTNYVNGADPTTATLWNLLVDDAPLAPTAFAPTAISISALAGNNVHIAFRYTGEVFPYRCYYAIQQIIKNYWAIIL